MPCSKCAEAKRKIKAMQNRRLNQAKQVVAAGGAEPKYFAMATGLLSEADNIQRGYFNRERLLDILRGDLKVLSNDPAASDVTVTLTQHIAAIDSEDSPYGDTACVNLVKGIADSLLKI